MQVTLPDEALPARLTLNPELRMSDDEFYAFCAANPSVRFERTAEGEIVIVPPAGGESDYQSLGVGAQLSVWARRDGRGKAFGSSVEFILPTGAALSPDAAWVSNQRISQLSKLERRKFPHICPEFIVEVMSPTDRLKPVQQKMQEWLRAGVELAWLIEPDSQTVYIYRQAQADPEVRAGLSELAGEGPVEGFELDLTDIWAGL